MAERLPFPLIKSTTLTGRLIADPELFEARNSDSRDSVKIRFVVKNRTKKYDSDDYDKGDYDREEESDLFVDCFLNGGWGEYALENLEKGHAIVIQGDLYFQSGAWEDKEGNLHDNWNVRNVVAFGPEVRWYEGSGETGRSSGGSARRRGRSEDAEPSRRRRRGSDDSDSGDAEPTRRRRRAADEDTVEETPRRRRAAATTDDDSAEEAPRRRRRAVEQHGDQ